MHSGRNAFLGPQAFRPKTGLLFSIDAMRRKTVCVAASPAAGRFFNPGPGTEKIRHIKRKPPQ
jgi:hypothetical protein